nr:hypothetical protein Iba_chr10fCG8760 [Ipomoea batatas]
MLGLLNLLKRLVLAVHEFLCWEIVFPGMFGVVEQHEIVASSFVHLVEHMSRKIEGRQAWAWIDRWNSNNSSISSSSLWLHKLLSKTTGWTSFMLVVEFVERYDMKIVDHPLPVFLENTSPEKLKKAGFGSRPSSTFLGFICLASLGLHTSIRLEISGIICLNNAMRTHLPRLFESCGFCKEEWLGPYAAPIGGHHSSSTKATKAGETPFFQRKPSLRGIAMLHQR